MLDEMIEFRPADDQCLQPDLLLELLDGRGAAALKTVADDQGGGK